MGIKENENRWQRIWNVTNARAAEWRRKHGRHGLSAEMWNNLWERVRDELYGVAWACEEAHSAARRVTWA